MTDNVTLMFALWLDGHNLDQLAKRFGYTKAFVAAIIDDKINPANLFEQPRPPELESNDE